MPSLELNTIPHGIFGTSGDPRSGRPGLVPGKAGASVRLRPSDTCSTVTIAVLGGLDVEPTDRPQGFRVAGDLDVSTVAVLADALDPAIDAGGDLRVDLSSVHFVDSTGLQLLMRTARRLEGRGRLILVSPQPRVRLLFQYVLLDRRANVEILGTDDLQDGSAKDTS
jgi:anti-anti-sigma factor